MLDVYLYDTHIGRVIQDPMGISFIYNERALDEPDRFCVSVRLPVRKESYPQHLAAPFFDNLLPEGDARDLIAQAAKYDRSDVQGLLGAIGGECAGAISLWPVGEAPAATPEYVPCSAGDLERMFGENDTSEFTRAHVAGRQSLSGAQNKLALLRQGTTYFLPRSGAPTNVLLKRERRQYPGLVQNELACLKLMEAVGVTVAVGSAPAGLSGLFESQRYDRLGVDNRLIRLHQEDFCQATGKFPRQKYQKHGGPALADIATVLVRYSTDPLTDLDGLARWTLANICLGNNDAHAKNLSLLYTPSGIRLAPLYDVVCTLAYPAIDREFSLAVGGGYTLESVTQGTGRKLARSLQMSPARVEQLLDEVTTQLAVNVDDVCHTVAVTYGDVSVLSTIRDIVLERGKALRTQLTS